jgi:bifunctional non-homologous end joining protein LigD
VNFQYGRRGSALSTGTKTASPVDYEQACKTYDKLVKEKMGKGYTPDEGGAAYQSTPKDQSFTGILPQLLNPVREEDLDTLFDNEKWIVQQKFDGKRIMVQKIAAEVTGINRKGLQVALPQPVVDAVRSMHWASNMVLDGELVGGRYHVFDVLSVERDLRQETYFNRLMTLHGMFELLPVAHKQSVGVVDTAFDPQAKRQMLDAMRASRLEGIVLKRTDAAYAPGRPNTGGSQLKFKLTESATLQVSSTHPSKRSVSVSGSDENGKMVDLGNVTIPANHDIPSVGDIVEIRYLYAYPGGSLYQPVYLGKRDDQGLDACTTSQLKLKPAGAGDDEEADETLKLAESPSDQAGSVTCVTLEEASTTSKARRARP